MLTFKGSNRLAEVSGFQGSRMRGLKQKVKPFKNTNATEQLSFIFPIMQKVNSWHKLLIQVCQEADQKHTEFSSMFCMKFNRFSASDVLQGREGYFLKEKCHLKKMWKILLLYLLHVSIVKQLLILF